MADRLLITILCSLEIEQKLLDLLLITPSISIFTSRPLAAHGITSLKLSQQEQVLGQIFAVQIQAIINTADKEKLLAQISEQFAGASIRYWTTNVLEVGEII